MAFESAVAAPNIEWDLVMHWPTYRANIAWGDAIDNTKIPLYHPPAMDPLNGSLQQMILGEYHAAGAALSEWVGEPEDDQFCYACRQLAPAGNRNYKFWGWPAVPKPKLTAANMGPGSRQISLYRVWWCQFLFKMECTAGNLGIDNGIAMTEETGPWGNAPWFDKIAASQPGGFGFIGNSLGTGFDYISMTPGVAAPGGIIEQVAVPPAVAPMGQWNTGEFWIINSAPGRNAYIVAKMNGVTIVTRNWAAGPGQLPAYTAAGYGYALRGQLQTPGPAADCSWYWGGVEIRMGRFTPDGLELTA